MRHRIRSIARALLVVVTLSSSVIGAAGSVNIEVGPSNAGEVYHIQITG